MKNLSTNLAQETSIGLIILDGQAMKKMRKETVDHHMLHKTDIASYLNTEVLFKM